MVNKILIWIIGILVTILIIGGIVAGIFLIPQTTQAFAVQGTTDSVMSCNLINNLCSFSVSSSNRASTFEFILGHGVSIPITESKCEEIEGNWKSNRCFINKLLSKQMGNITYTKQSTYTANGRTETSIVNSFSEERIIVGDPCPSCGGEFKSISVAWNMPLIDPKKSPIPNYLLYSAIAVIAMFIIIITLIILRKKL